MFKSLLDEHQAKQTRLKEEVGTSSPFPAPEPIEPRAAPRSVVFVLYLSFIRWGVGKENRKFPVCD